MRTFYSTTLLVLLSVMLNFSYAQQSPEMMRKVTRIQNAIRDLNTIQTESGFNFQGIEPVDTQRELLAPNFPDVSGAQTPEEEKNIYSAWIEMYPDEHLNFSTYLETYIRSHLN